jgi:ubiquinone/menaquinone biosynthesis C-methylase UbiE
MSGYIDLLASLPKSKRDVKTRFEAKDPEVIRIAKEYGKEYFDGDRKYGYGGYQYDGRWLEVARSILRFFELKPNARILDIGCGKGFLVYDLMKESPKLDVYGLDISEYAIKNSPVSIRHRLKQGNAKKLPFSDKSFDLVISINTLHNLSREGVIKALQEIERVSCGKSYVVVDSYYSQEQKEEFQQWVLTAETHGFPEQWLGIFKEAEYNGWHSWNILS